MYLCTVFSEHLLGLKAVETETRHKSLASIFVIRKLLSLSDIQFYW